MLYFQKIFKFMVCLFVVAAFIGCASTDKRSGTGEKFDDTVITTKVKSAIFAEPDLKVLQISVETFKGVVQLSGFVDSAQSVRKAGEVARAVEGVESVKNNLIVR
ncbi:BON domain-containing protein [Geoalkalibacter ferrihydriticus]|uniref:Osmotically-inducible protein Y n=2 Tax=Geoalkalibacter ferrihydriticus TaxID=392333 RepID=A0A0C2HW46_9BACT|nr:BON domain-containing protein [Geoalkalibacter ferrihydriticus]KIH76997.1 transporter [Geoalkalibacter ferrihydriticus DSM 17813]SDL40135.1 BON domain-containing protein [Geoalkalibacter ferrihydriticus]